MSENVKVVWPECGVCHGKGIKQVKEGWTVCDHTPTLGIDVAVDEFVTAMRPSNEVPQSQQKNTGTTNKPPFLRPLDCPVCNGTGRNPVTWEEDAIDRASVIKDDPRQPPSPREERAWENICKTLREQRQPDYGEPRACHYAIALAWNALIMQKLKATDGDASLDERMVALMLAAMKLVREAYHHKQDNLDDAAVYIQFCSEFSGEPRK